MGHWSWLRNIHSTLFPPSNYVWLGLTPSQLQQRGLIDMSLSSNPVPLLQGWPIGAQHFPGCSDWAHDLRWSNQSQASSFPRAGMKEESAPSFFPWLDGNKKNTVPRTSGSQLTTMGKISLRRKLTQEGRAVRISEDGAIA